MQVADAVAHILQAEGVEILFAYPLNPLIDAAAKAGIRPVIVRQERTGLHMADAYSRLHPGRRIGVFCMQSGPGAENAFGGVAQAYAESVPLVVLPMGYPRSQSQVDPNFNASRAFAPVVKSSQQLIQARDLVPTMRRAFNLARNGRPRPALVEFPQDILTEECPEPLNYTPSRPLRSGPDPEAVESAAEALVHSQRPVLFAGQGVHYARAWEALRSLAELLAAPVATSLGGKSAFAEDHPLALGTAGRSMPQTAHHFMQQADLICGVGTSFTATNFGTLPAPGKTVIHATLDATDIDKDVPCHHALVGDARLTLEALGQAVGDRLGGQPRSQTRVTEEIGQIKSAWLDQWMPKLRSDQSPLTPYRVIWDLLHSVDVEQTIITHDSGSPRDQLVPFWSSRAPLSYLGWGKSTQLGYGLGLALGAKLARPDKLCINVWGDAAIGFTGMDVETAVRENIPILSILFNNFSMAIELPVMEYSTAHYRSTDISGDYAAMARSFGAYGERVERPEDIIPALQRGMEQTREGHPALLEFITCKEIDYSIF